MNAMRAREDPKRNYPVNVMRHTLSGSSTFAPHATSAETTSVCPSDAARNRAEAPSCYSAMESVMGNVMSGTHNCFSLLRNPINGAIRSVWNPQLPLLATSLHPSPTHWGYQVHARPTVKQQLHRAHQALGCGDGQRGTALGQARGVCLYAPLLGSAAAQQGGNDGLVPRLRGQMQSGGTAVCVLKGKNRREGAGI